MQLYQNFLPRCFDAFFLSLRLDAVVDREITRIRACQGGQLGMCVFTLRGLFVFKLN